MPPRQRFFALAAAFSLVCGTVLVISSAAPPPSSAQVLTGAAMPLQEFVNDGLWGRLWNDYNQTADSSGPAMTGRPSAVTYGTAVHVDARANGGALYEFDNDNLWGRTWNAYNLTAASGGPNIAADPSALLVGGTALHIFAEAANGDLYEFENNGAAGHTWNAYDVTALSGGSSVGGDPSPVLSGSTIEVFARSSSGDLVEFSTPSGSQSWTATDITAASSGPSIGGDPAAAVVGTSTHVYASSTSGDLLEFVNGTGSTWTSSDLTSVTSGPGITGQPSPVVVGSSIDVVARSSGGDLVDFAYGSTWTESDLSQASGGPTIVGSPAAVLYGTSEIHVYGESAANHVVEFVNDGLSGRTWNDYDLTVGSAGSTVGGDLSPLVYGHTIHVYAGGPPPASPPEGVGLYGLATNQTAQAIEDNWPIIGDTGALGTQTAPYTGLNTGADLATGEAIQASGRRVTWLSFWTVSGPVANGPGGTPCYTSDCYYADSYAAGQWVAQTIDSYASQGLHIKPDWVILDPEGYPDNHSGLDSGAGSSDANWVSFLQGWANGIASVDPSLRAAFYADQSEINGFNLSAIQLPEFVAIAFPDPVNVLQASTNIAGFIAFGATCPAAGEEATEAGPGWDGSYNTLQFTGNQYCGP